MDYAALYPEFLVADLARSEAFYTGLLGFRVAYRRDEERFVFLVGDDGSGSGSGSGEGGGAPNVAGGAPVAQLMLLEDNANSHSRTGELAWPRGQGVNFSILTRQLDAIAARLAAAGHPLRIPIREQWHRVDDALVGERQLWVQDPDGYLLRFVEGLGRRDAATIRHDR